MSDANITNKDIYQKLLEARKMYTEISFKKDKKVSFKSTSYSYMDYPSLKEKVDPILQDLKLMLFIDFTQDSCRAQLVDVDNPNSSLCFTSPITYTPGNIQTLGALHTYMRRYMTFLVFDIAVEDEVDRHPNGSQDGDEVYVQPVNTPSVERLKKLIAEGGYDDVLTAKGTWNLFNRKHWLNGYTHLPITNDNIQEQLKTLAEYARNNGKIY